MVHPARLAALAAQPVCVIATPARTITARVEKPGGQFVTSASMLLVIVLLLILLTIWLALLLFAIALCRGAASADGRAVAASAERPIPEQPIRFAGHPRTVAARARTVARRARYAAPRRYYSASRARRGTKHTPRAI